jgi:hypothetical protein
VVFESDYLREHVHLGYAITVHAAQGVTANTAHAVIAESASRSMAYVAMSRGRDTNHAYIYTHFSGEADHEHTTPVVGDNVHILRRDTKYAAAQYFRMILANDERPRTMHAEAECADRELLPEIVGGLLDRHDARRAARRQDWRETHRRPTRVLRALPTPRCRHRTRRRTRQEPRLRTRTVEGRRGGQIHCPVSRRRPPERCDQVSVANHRRNGLRFWIIEAKPTMRSSPCAPVNRPEQTLTWRPPAAPVRRPPTEGSDQQRAVRTFFTAIKISSSGSAGSIRYTTPVAWQRRRR